MNCHQLSIEEHSCTRKYYVEGPSYRAIARLAGRNVSTISREIRRNCTHMELSIHAHLIFPEHIQRGIQPTTANKILCRDAGGGIRQGELMYLADAGLLGFPVGVLLNGDGIMAGVLIRANILFSG